MKSAKRLSKGQTLTEILRKRDSVHLMFVSVPELNESRNTLYDSILAAHDDVESKH